MDLSPFCSLRTDKADLFLCCWNASLPFIPFLRKIGSKVLSPPCRCRLLGPAQTPSKMQTCTSVDYREHWVSRTLKTCLLLLGASSTQECWWTRHQVILLTFWPGLQIHACFCYCTRLLVLFCKSTAEHAVRRYRGLIEGPKEYFCHRLCGSKSWVWSVRHRNTLKVRQKA